MRILHYVDTTDTREGGVPRFVLDASRVMASRGHDVTILTCDTTDTPPTWLDGSSGVDGVKLPHVLKVSRSSLPGGFLSLAGMRAVREQLSRADVLHLHAVWNRSNLQIAALARRMGVPYICTAHGMLDDWCMEQGGIKKRAYLALGARHMLEEAAMVHCTATGELQQSGKWFPRGRGEVVPLLMDLSAYQTLPGRSLARDRSEFLRASNDPVVLFLSRLNVKKGCEVLLHAAALLRDRGARARFVFAGTGDAAYVNSLRSLCTQLELDDRVCFTGQVKGAEKLSLYQNADLFALPTSQENFGLVLIEALACGTPIVTTRGTDIWQDLERSGAATIVDQTAERFADAIATQLSNTEALRESGMKARPWVFANYDESVLASRYERMYSECAAAARAGQRAVAPANHPALASV